MSEKRDKHAIGSDSQPPATPAEPAHVYANLVRVAYTATEFVLEFCHVPPALDQQRQAVRVQSRVVLPPPVVAQLHEVLGEATARIDKHAPGESLPRP